MLNQPLDLLLDHLLGGEEHVFEDVDQLGLQLGVGDALAHLEDLDDGLLGAEDPELDDAFVVLLAGLLSAQLKPTDQVQLPSLLELAVLQYTEAGRAKNCRFSNRELTTCILFVATLTGSCGCYLLFLEEKSVSS